LDFEFVPCLIHKKTKQPYNWYELRFALDKNDKLKPLIDGDEVRKIYDLLVDNNCLDHLYMATHSEKEMFDTFKIVLENINEGYETIIGDTLDIQEIVLGLLRFKMHDEWGYY
jgi:hypothetical protein